MGAEYLTIALNYWKWRRIFKNSAKYIISYYAKDCNQSDILRLKAPFDLALKGTIESFSQIKECFRVKKTILNRIEWLKSICTCPGFLKEYICPHIIALAIKYELCDAPLAAKNVPLGERRKRGRPSLAKKAFIRQWIKLLYSVNINKLL